MEHAADVAAGGGVVQLLFLFFFPASNTGCPPKQHPLQKQQVLHDCLPPQKCHRKDGLPKQPLLARHQK